MNAQLGGRLRRHRLTAGLSLEALSQTSGISDRTISNIERGVSSMPQRRTLTALFDALELSGDERRALLRLARAPRSDDELRSRVLAPHPISDFTGRLDVLGDLTTFSAVRTERSELAVVVVSGPAGVGKTTVALESLRRWSGGGRQVFADLDGLHAVPPSPLQVLQALLMQLSDGEATVATLDEAIVQWRRITGDGPVAVVLDNAASEEQVRPVLTAAPGSLVVVTARRSLSALADVRRISLEPLSRAESTQLIGRIVPPRQRTDADVDRLASACGDLPLPLALRIAGNRIASRPRSTTADFVRNMLTRQEPLRALVAGDLAVESALELSYELTDTTSRRLFKSLALLEGPTFDADLAAAATGADREDTADRLDELIELGLVEERGGNRYHLHDLVRLFAEASLRRGEDDVIVLRERLRRWVLSTTRNAGLWFEPDMHPSDSAHGRHFDDDVAARAWLTTEAPQWSASVEEAYTLGDDRSVMDTADALHWFSDTWPAWDHWRALFSRSAAAASRSGDQTAIAVHHGYLAWVHLTQGEFERARAVAERAVRAAERAADDRQHGWALFYRAWAEHTLHREDAARSAAAALDRLTRAGDQDGITQVILLTADVLRTTGHPDAAVEHYLEVLDLLAEHREQLQPNVLLVTDASTKTLLALALTNAGNPDYALRTMPGVIEDAERGRFSDGVARAHLELGRAAKCVGDHSLGDEHLRAAHQLASANGLQYVLKEIEAVA